jgi:hypothetical protein
MMIRRQATTVVTRAPTATGLTILKPNFIEGAAQRLIILNQYHQKSLGVPNQVRGVNPAATITIQTQIEKLTPTEAKSD